MDPSSLKNVNIPPPEQSGEIYTNTFLSGGSKMFQHEILGLAPATSRFTIYIKTTESPSIEISTGKIQLFATTR